MQFHLNGFRAGDPRVAESRRVNDAEGGVGAQLPSEVDVLIVGSGPAGLTLAAQLSSFDDITTRIVEAKPGPMELGQADGIACRTMEMFEAFGFSERVLAEGYQVNETTFWKPDPDDTKRIRRSGRVQDTEDGLSEFPHMILNQARVHDFFLDVMRSAPSRLEPDYGCRLVDVTVDDHAGTHPVTATIEGIDPSGHGGIHHVRARYLVGCDGARSAVRTSIDRALHGDSANQAWGVMDVLAVTDFPDIRFKSLIQSDGNGTIVVIPREGGYLVRMYIELDQIPTDRRVRNLDITPDDLITAARRILHPYSLEVKEIPWWSVYEIGQRLCEAFDDTAGRASDRTPCVFIAGDACHTHSPKAGQGMNVSMRDSFNLGWKLAAVLRGSARPEILHTYNAERHAVARQLIDFDREWAQVLSGRPGADGPPRSTGDDQADGSDVSAAPTDETAPAFQHYFVKSGRYTAGVGITYEPSLLCATPTHQHLAPGFEIGARFHSAPVLRVGDARPMHLGHVAKADGRWRLYAFAGVGDTAGDGSPMHDLCRYLVDDATSPTRRYTPAGADPDAVFDVRGVFHEGHRELDIGSMPPILRPLKGRLGLVDYEKVFCRDLRPGHDIYDLRGIETRAGCLVVVRPDQHVANILPLAAHVALADFFDRFMRPID